MEWKVKKISEVGTVVGGGTPSTKNPSFYHGDIPWITPKDLSGYDKRYISRGERNISKEGYESSSAKMMPPHTILFTSRAPIGYVAISDCSLCTNQGFKSVIPNDDTDYLFLYYSLLYNAKKIKDLGGGTTFAEISGSAMKNIEISIPDYETQKTIGYVLGTIDDRIETNNAISENLEEQLKELFKKMFGTRIDEASVQLGDLVDIIDNRGKTPQLEDQETDYPIIDVRALNGDSRIIDYSNCTKYVNENIFNTFFRNGHPRINDILISTVGTLAELKIITEKHGCIAQNVVGLRAKATVSPYYLYQYLKYIKNDLISYNIGTVQPSIKVTHIIKHKIYIPSKAESDKFNPIAEEITNQIAHNYRENKKLIALRSVLLNKLMSGEIDVSRVKMEV